MEIFRERNTGEDYERDFLLLGSRAGMTSGGRVGGPLLSIGDLLSDLSQHHQDATAHPDLSSKQQPQVVDHHHHRPLHLQSLFEENYEQLNEALTGTGHSWTALTLKLCTAVETADRLVQSANSNAGLLLEKVEVLESILRRGDSAIAKAKTIKIRNNVSPSKAREASI
ncbi:hypothetical protein AMTR_s00173p00047230 [Amborella trichopoda]|uniref:Uncharacterized protein n=3 Tax=Amborella trichopoda TaxID=13333 RepID=W1NQB4_AMBTC|nr:hypothetical protein AMTR_s00173p00047230 [Amborella trichopoda]